LLLALHHYRASCGIGSAKHLYPHLVSSHVTAHLLNLAAVTTSSMNFPELHSNILLNNFLANVQAGDYDDLNGAQELALGRVVKEKFGADFFIVDRYPSAVRPFYTMPCPDNDKYSNSYDLFLRGQEICSGAQRCHDANMLSDIIQSKGVPLQPLTSYINSFKAGCVPHGGAGIGLERVVFLYLGLDNVRKASMFPRDPNRCSP
jgi:aspartyl/asparaginyl-tRNA synthetase